MNEQTEGGYNPETDINHREIRDDRGRLVSKAFLIGDQRVIVNFEYVGNSQSPSKKYATDNKGIIRTVTEYEYDDDGNEIIEIERDADGKIISSHEKSYDEDGNVLTDRIQEADGSIHTDHYTYRGDEIIIDRRED